MYFIKKRFSLKFPWNMQIIPILFFLHLITKLLKNITIKMHAMKLIKRKYPPYGSIYSINSVELKTLKAYFEIYLKTKLIWPQKFFIVAAIISDKNLKGCFYIYVNYWHFNNLTIKNWYFLPLIGKSSDWLYYTQ